jgi:hypothetical protein
MKWIEPMAKKSSVKKSKKNAFAGFKREKKTLKGPFTQISEQSPGFLKKSTWHDVQMPEFLWVALILGAFETNDAIQRLRNIAQQWPDISEFEGQLCQPGSLSAIAALKPVPRHSLLATILEVVESKSVLAPLCHLSQLPGRDDWVSLFAEDETIEHWFAIGDAVQACSRFQGEGATHICWFISMVGSESGQLTAAQGIDDEFRAMRSAYPENAEDVGGFFRCEAGSTRFIESEWPEKFWEEVYRKLSAAPAPPEHFYLTDNEFGAAFWFTSLLVNLSEHYWNTRKGSNDVIHETAFGIVLAAVSLAYEVIELRLHNRFGGLAALRTVTECVINLSYLAVKNDPQTWHRFRAYGSGQAHLIAIKLGNELASASCVDKQYLQAFLFEEDPQMFTDIQLGDWAGENIRSRAEKGGTKDLYDSYYDYSSSMLHGDWLGAATFGLTWDMNPLHRLQRVPREFPRCLPSVVPDLCRVCNRLLAVMDNGYPDFKFRLPEPALATEEEAPDDHGPEE